MSRQWSYYLFLCLAVALRVAGQTSNVTTCVPEYAWSLNSKQQTPCLVAAYLETLCGVPTSVDAIPVGTHYLGPAMGQSDQCRCSTVTYSAVSACGGCQGRTFQNWTTWSGNCINGVEVASFPKIIPTEVEVPQWMYINITLIGNNFDPILAQQILNGSPTPSSPIVSVTSTTSSSTSSSATLPPTTQTPEAAAAQGSSKKSNAGAIAGGTIAGLVVLAIIGLYILWRVMQKRRNAVQRDFSFDSRALVTGPAMSQQFTGSTGINQSISHTTSPGGPSPVPFGGQSTYGARTSDHGHGAYPISPVTSSGVYTSPGPGRRSLESVSLSLMQLGGHQNPSQARGYRGAAELS